MKVLFAADHAGYNLKQTLISFVSNELHYEVEDMGALTLDENDDYPDFIHPLAQKVSNDSSLFGVILGGSGQGEAIVANRHHGVRAAVYYGGPADIIKLSREHNNANVLSLGARFISDDEAKAAVKFWLSTSFTGEERHTRRIAKID